MLRANLATLAEEGYEALLPLIHPEFEMETPAGLAAEPQTYRGPEGIRRWWESFYEVMDEVRVEPSAFHDAGDGLVAVEITIHARGQASGLEVTQAAALLVDVEGELLRRIRIFGTLDEAMAAAA